VTVVIPEAGPARATILTQVESCNPHHQDHWSSVGNDGVFVFENIPNGKYVCKASPLSFTSHDEAYWAKDFQISGSDLVLEIDRSQEVPEVEVVIALNESDRERFSRTATAGGSTIACLVGPNRLDVRRYGVFRWKEGSIICGTFCSVHPGKCILLIVDRNLSVFWMIPVVVNHSDNVDDRPVISLGPSDLHRVFPVVGIGEYLNSIEVNLECENVNRSGRD
jgi:hypothetical protein